MEREIYYIWLNGIKGIGPVLATNLLNYFGDIVKVYNSSKEEHKYLLLLEWQKE